MKLKDWYIKEIENNMPDIKQALAMNDKFTFGKFFIEIGKSGPKVFITFYHPEERIVSINSSREWIYFFDYTPDASTIYFNSKDEILNLLGAGEEEW